MRMKPAIVLGVWLLTGAALAGTAGSAAAQVPERPWEIEGYGGLARGWLPADGVVDLPLPGAPLATSSPIFPSRQVPSWFFGDGAALLNGANTDFGLDARLTPIDAVFGLIAPDRATAGTLGFRARRAVSTNYSVELDVGLMTDAVALGDDVRAAVEATRASFEPAFEALFASGPFTDVAVAAAGSIVDATSQIVVATAAAQMRFGSGGGLTPYVTLGGGLLSSRGDLVTVVLEGSYRASIVGTVPLEEVDRVTIHFARETVPVGLIGGGVARDMSARWGLRVDGRVLISENRTRGTIDTAATVSTGVPAGFIESFTNPSVQFSNDPSTGRQSSLSGPALQGFTAFRGDGLQTRLLLNVGVYVRF